MTEDDTTQRAVAILDAARTAGMYPQPTPESPETVVAEAKKIVELSQQARVVAEKAGKDKVPKYEGIMSVLAVAGVVDDVSSNGGGGEVAPEPRPTQAGAVEGQANDPPPPTTPPPPAPTPSPVTVAETPPVQPEQDQMTGRWCDEDGLIWVIDQDLGDDLEVHMDGDAEKTTVPRDFLKQRVGDAPPVQELKPQKEKPSSHSSQDSPQQEQSGSEESPSSESGTPAPDPPPAEKPSDGESPSEPRQPSPPSSSGPSPSGDTDYDDLLKRVEADYLRAGLPIPGDVQNPPEMPEDLTANETENRRLHSAFNSCAGRARYLFGLERQRKIGCQRLQKEALKGPMRRARQELGAKATATEVTMLAEEDEQVKRWTKYTDVHADREAALKDLFEVYSKNVEVLSRDFSMSGRELGGHNR